jgi:N-acetyl-anhydromuramyl-L-alanine amidase AmpD
VARYPAAQWIPASPENFRRARREEPRELVIHTVEGNNVEALHTWLTSPDEPNISVHFAVDKAGNVYQYVDTDDEAWHARDHNRFSIGIEHVGYAAEPSTWTPQMVSSSARLAAWVNEVHPDVALDDEHIVAHGSFQEDRTDPGPHFPWVDYIARARAYRSGGLVSSIFGGGATSVVVVVVVALALAQLWTRNG